eukprot:CAMPEP_0116844516 /NCGR_PEP_ID=MMETSP0418-20121206/12737_1 /TAXON_ID=1158023 /ORGANISM="Astrosyne radiata, Strain 13vi08-1A" /LENGTH=239 /DNA_ID=CAMNT_0004475489 /DNA_START=45 /DNA_END=760 /DNA_ORIENTATION=-
MADNSSVLGPSAEVLAKLSWKPIQSNMPTPRRSCAATVAENRLLVFGGRNAALWLSAVEAYDAENDTWTILPSMPTSRRGCAAVTIDGKVYVFGGYNGFYLSRVEVMDLVAQTWAALPFMRHKRWGCSAGVIGEFMIVVGGSDDFVNHVTAEMFNLTTQQWEDLPKMSFPHVFGTIVVIETRAYVFGGGNNKMEVFDLEWTTLPSTKTKFSRGIAAVAVGRYIVVCGGSDVVEVFDTES